MPDSSLRYLLTINEEAGQSALETHINFIEGKPVQQIPVSRRRIPVTDLYDFVKEKLKSIKKEVVFNHEWFKQMKNLFIGLMPQSAKYKDIIGVYEASDKNLKIMSDVVSQKVICFSDKRK